MFSFWYRKHYRIKNKKTKKKNQWSKKSQTKVRKKKYLVNIIPIFISAQHMVTQKFQKKTNNFLETYIHFVNVWFNVGSIVSCRMSKMIWKTNQTFLTFELSVDLILSRDVWIKSSFILNITKYQSSFLFDHYFWVVS